ncbi:MAG: substrate-binding domain-containing protein [Nitriliruptorales bacterium]|nr:substrate-binding domain-containing protein [Nitriliruptorales bacterium]
MPTIYDVAQLASVSPATVSRVINERGNVDPEMTRRVREAVKTLNYRPNGVARNLRRQSAAVWTVIISDIENAHFTALVRGIEDVAHSSGHSVVLCNSDEDLRKERRYVDVALAERAAGVIISPASNRHSTVAPLLERGVPVVTIDRTLRTSTVNAVVVDNAKGARCATEHLLESGYERVGCIVGPLRTSTAAQRLAGYRRALKAAGLRRDADLERLADAKEGGGYLATRSLLEGDDPPDALFVGNGLMTAGALRYLTENGVDIPGQVGIVGFDEQLWATLLRPALTTVAQPTYDLGQAAAEMLLERGRDPDAPARTVTMPTRLIVRASSVRPRARARTGAR